MRSLHPERLVFLLLVQSVAFAQVHISLSQRAKHSCVNEPNAIVARKLTKLAEASRDAGELVRAYLLYSEAARCDAATVAYQEKRDALAPVAKLLIRNKLDGDTSIDVDIADARSAASVEVEAAEPPIYPAAAISTNAFAERDSQAPGVQPKSDPDAAAASDVPPNNKAFADSHVKLTFPTYLLAYATYQAVRKDSPFNPSNLLAKLPIEDFHAALRPDLKLTYSIFSFSAKPRIEYDRTLQSSTNNVSSYLQEWSARVQITSSVTLSYGREVLMWGPSMSVPASNPFFTDNGRNTPLLEVGARDFGRIIWQPTSHWSFSYIANTALRRGTPSPEPFRKTSAFKADYVGSGFLLSGIYSDDLSRPFGNRKFIGGYMQATLGQAVRVYVEGSAEQQNPALFPQTSNNAVGWTFAQSELNAALKPRTIVAGTAYTDVKGGTWTGEYIYNPFGYTRMFAASYFNMAQDLSSSFQQGGVNSQLAAEELASAKEPGNYLLRRNYAFGQYQRNGLAGHFDLVLRYTLSADDRSGQGVAYLTWNYSDHFQFFTIFAGMNGSPDTEFARYLRYQAQLGVRLFLH